MLNRNTITSAPMLLIFALLAGCVTAYPDPQPGEEGRAVKCMWILDHPVLCTEDHERLTIDIDSYYTMILRLEQNRIDEYNRRKL